jgi:hypothetical protein
MATAAGNLSAAATVPAGTDFAVAFWSHRGSGLGNSVAQSVSIGGQAMTIVEQVPTNAAESGSRGLGMAVLAAPPTGSQTRALAWSPAGARSEGGHVLFVYYSGVDQVAPVRASGVSAPGYWGSPSVELTSVQSTDRVMGIGTGTSWSSSINLNGVPLLIDNDFVNNEHLDFGDDTGLTGTVTLSAREITYASVAAIALRESGVTIDEATMELLANVQLPVLTALPSAGKAGRLACYAGRLWLDDGAQWTPVSAGNSMFLRRAATPSIAGDAAGTALGTLALTASRLYFVPFVPARDVTLTGLRISVTTAAAGAASVGIYDNAKVSGDDAPGALLASATGLDTGSTGDKTGSVSITLRAGTPYWASVIAAAAATVRALAVGSVASSLGREVNNTTAVTHLYAAGSGSTLPTTAPTNLTAGTGSTPAIYLVE